MRSRYAFDSFLIGEIGMANDQFLGQWSVVIQLAGAIAQTLTAVFALIVAVTTFKFTKKQNSLALINENNSLANQVNLAILSSTEAASTFARLRKPIVGSSDDAIIFMYLNYVHNTFRTKKIGAITPTVWTDTLKSCSLLLSSLPRDQVIALLSRGYESEFRSAILLEYDTIGQHAQGGKA